MHQNIAFFACVCWMDSPRDSPAQLIFMHFLHPPCNGCAADIKQSATRPSVFRFRVWYAVSGHLHKERTGQGRHGGGGKGRCCLGILAIVTVIATSHDKGGIVGIGATSVHMQTSASQGRRQSGGKCTKVAASEDGT